MKVIALDGPAGSGKSTIAGMLAEKIGFLHADSGAIYRTLTLASMQKLGAGNSPQDFGELFQKAVLDPDQLGIQVVLADGKQSNRIGQADVGREIRTPEVTSRIRFIADNVPCRNTVNRLLREFAEQTGVVADGRDMGTVVFPDTPNKFFLEASVEVRARRRYEEMLGQGSSSQSLAEIERDIARRDQEDRSRAVGALRKADDAILIDTSDLSRDGVLSRILAHIQYRF
ncbi:MAG: cytidylate kinase [Spirochaetaceae bacterium]|nr:cytidylate kinase [Spirochaetaceae bacterium]|tara:strand:- start:20282 stop:20968 length:687 start_codon:yes stop_codon:yes gene_type:complete